MRRSDLLRRPAGALTVLACAVLAACSSAPKGSTPDNEPTLKTLAGRKVQVERDAGVASSEEQAMAAYQAFLRAAPKASQRAEAMRRMGDLEMDIADNRIAAGQGKGTVEDYKAAITRYQDYLKTYPNDPKNDRVIYQLARAYEQGGELETALKTLDRLMAAHPDTAYRDEAQFRRGELLFTAQDYVKAEKAYATVLASAARTPFHERALYMQGWSQFKQGRLEEALGSFFGVLDLTLPADAEDRELEEIASLKRADRELVEDTFRVTSICLENLQGAQTIPAYIDSDVRRGYEFRVYQQLASLYLKQERTKDAADTLGAFARLHPQHVQAPVMQARVIEIYEQNNFPGLALEAKKQYVVQYGASSELRTTSPAAWQRAQPLVKGHLSALARHHHALAQKDKKKEDVQEAARWYRELLTAFPDDPEAPQQRFLLAELLFEDKRFAEAAVEYEKVAYEHVGHPRGADAGYAALLALAEQRKLAAPEAQTPIRREAVASSLRFAKAYPGDARAAPVLANAADELYALRDATQADAVAQQLLAPEPPAPAAQRRVAWTVRAHTAFERDDFLLAEKAYGEALALAPADDKGRPALVERLAAAVYKQGEQARAAGQTREAVEHFSRIAAVAPTASVRANAQYDAASALVTLKDWDGATKTLEDFRQRFPNHPLADDVTGKLALAYQEKGQTAQAAAEFERLAATKKEPEVARAAQWQAAELYGKAGSRANATRAYERYLAQYPQPFEPAMEARWRLAKLAKEDGQRAKELARLKEIVAADRAAGAARTPRSKTLGGLATLALTEPVFEDYRKVQLVEPLQRQLKLKKARMEEVLKAYANAAEYGQAEVTTAATFHTAALYQDFGKALIGSQRPKGLKKAELEQYNVMLEEQAYPFEEKAIELHQTNARNAANGIYDDWVKKSYEALRTLRPARYGKAERSEGVIDAIQ